MKIFSEKEAEGFLMQEKFDVVPGFFIRNLKELQMSLKKLGFPVVMKVSGKKIIHKARVGGVIVGIKTYTHALESFKKLKKIKGAKGMIIQREISGSEFLVGIKYTEDFGHVIAFGAGGSKVEIKKEISFRVFPFGHKEAREMINEISEAKELMVKDKTAIERVLFQVSDLLKKYPKISEMDLNPLMVKNGKAVIADARIVWK
jgi:hypothetical protein